MGLASASFGLVFALAAAAAPAQSYQCESEGFHVDPADCSKFVRCVDHGQRGAHLTPYFFSCPAGE